MGSKVLTLGILPAVAEEHERDDKGAEIPVENEVDHPPTFMSVTRVKRSTLLASLMAFPKPFVTLP